MSNYKEKTWDDVLSVSKAQLIKLYSKAYGVPGTAIKRIMDETGMSIEGAAEEVLRQQDENTFYLDGVLYKTVRSALDSAHVGDRTITNIAKKNDINKAEAIQLYHFLSSGNKKDPDVEHDVSIETDDQYLDLYSI